MTDDREEDEPEVEPTHRPPQLRTPNTDLVQSLPFEEPDISSQFQEARLTGCEECASIPSGEDVGLLGEYRATTTSSLTTPRHVLGVDQGIGGWEAPSVGQCGDTSCQRHGVGPNVL